MRAELDAAGVARAPAEPFKRPSVDAVRGPRRRLDWFEWGVLGVFAALSVWVLAVDLVQQAAHGLVWTGTDGFYIVDQMQYLAWIKDASHHFLASNLFVLRGTARDYFQPAVAISGGLAALGMAPSLALLLWKPVAVLAAFLGVRGYARRSVTGLWARRAVLVLGLFFASFTIIYGNLGVLGDLFPAFLSWGYTFGLVALAAMLFALLAYERARARGLSSPRNWMVWAPGLLGALASSLHPWQGEVLVLIVIGAELTLWRVTGRAPWRSALPGITLVLTGIPLLYYEFLGRFDPSWEMARDASMHGFSFIAILLALTPLLLPALLGYRGAPRTFLAAATRSWPVAALVIYVLSSSDFSSAPLHAFEGITIPLAVLAVQGVQRVAFSREGIGRSGWTGRRAKRVLAGTAIALATIPATAYLLQSATGVVAPSTGNANFITRGERDALRYLAQSPQPGGVLTRFYLGEVVPAETGRRTFVGNCLWSQPGCNPRAEMAEALLAGHLTDRAARTMVRNSGAQFVLADCRVYPGLSRVLAPLTQSVHRFGCATVYVLDAPTPPTGPLAESPPDAALRASGRQQRRGQPS